MIIKLSKKIIILIIIILSDINININKKNIFFIKYNYRYPISNIKKIKIAIFSTSLSNGGVERQTSFNNEIF